MPTAAAATTSKPLVVKGRGYTTPNASRRPPRGRGPFVMPSAPIKPTAAAPMPTRVALTPNAATAAVTSPLTRAGRGTSLDDIAANQRCSCQHPADVDFLKTCYVENMRMRIDLLEIENSYLKKNGDDETQPPPPHDANSNERAASGDNVRRTTTLNRKRVEFADRLFRADDRDAGSTIAVAAKSTLQASEAELFDRLEEAYQKEFRLHEKLKSLAADNRRLKAAAESRSANGDGNTAAAEDEIVRLQRRLDDLTPLLAAKDAEIERLSMERSQLVTKIRRLSTTTTSGQDRDANGSSSPLVDAARLRELQRELDESRQKERAAAVSFSSLTIVTTIVLFFSIAVTAARRSQKEAETAARREKTQRDSTTAEFEKLIKENARLDEALARADRLVAKRDRESRGRVDSAARIDELLASEERLRAQVATLDRRLAQQTEARATAEQQLRSLTLDDEAAQQSRATSHEELQALRALSDSLAAENQNLRQSKLAAERRTSRYSNRASEQEKTLRELARRLAAFNELYDAARRRLDVESQRHREAGHELASIARAAAVAIVESPIAATAAATTAAAATVSSSPSRAASADDARRPPTADNDDNKDDDDGETDQNGEQQTSDDDHDDDDDGETITRSQPPPPLSPLDPKPLPPKRRSVVAAANANRSLRTPPASDSRAPYHHWPSSSSQRRPSP